MWSANDDWDGLDLCRFVGEDGRFPCFLWVSVTGVRGCHGTSGSTDSARKVHHPIQANFSNP